MQKQPLPQAYAAKLVEYNLGGLNPANAQLIRYERGEWFLLEGREIEYLYILLSGKAKVCMSDASGHSLLLAYYLSDGIMGDVELMMGQHEAISSVQALSTLTCIGLPLSIYRQQLLDHLPFVLRVANGLSKKLHASVTSTTGIILSVFEARLCSYILQSAQNGCFSERLTNVAEQLGVSYRHLLRTLKSLCEAGLLEKRPDGYWVLDERDLREKAADKSGFRMRSIV